MRLEVIKSDKPIDNAAFVAARVSAFTGSNLHVSVTLANFVVPKQDVLITFVKEVLAPPTVK